MNICRTPAITFVEVEKPRCTFRTQNQRCTNDADVRIENLSAAQNFPWAEVKILFTDHVCTTHARMISRIVTGQDLV